MYADGPSLSGGQGLLLEVGEGNGDLAGAKLIGGQAQAEAEDLSFLQTGGC